MIEITRRKLLAVAAALWPLLTFRRAAAQPSPRIDPTPPLQTEPAQVPPEVCETGVWVDRSGWIYHQQLGWMHRFPYSGMKDMGQANWYGPPPPRAPMVPFDWGEALRQSEKALIAQTSAGTASVHRKNILRPMMG
jgi:hypothetical protein